MEDFLKVAMTNPERLEEWRVQRETWRIPAPNPPVVLLSNTNGNGKNQQENSSNEHKNDLDELSDEQRTILEGQDPIKFYQPANQRFYLVTASLVCHIPGLPDRMLNLSKAENVSFVLRRLIKDKDKQEEEYAFINEAWYRIPYFEDNNQAVAIEPRIIEKRQAVEKLYPGEQQFPMFPVTYDAKIDGHKRRMFAGLVPVSGREKFINAEINRNPLFKDETDNNSRANTDLRESQIDQLMTVIDMDVIQPWDDLLQQFKGIEREVEDEHGNPTIEVKPTIEWFIVDSLDEINKI